MSSSQARSLKEDPIGERFANGLSKSGFGLVLGAPASSRVPMAATTLIAALLAWTLLTLTGILAELWYEQPDDAIAIGFAFLGYVTLAFWSVVGNMRRLGAVSSLEGQLALLLGSPWIAGLWLGTVALATWHTFEYGRDEAFALVLNGLFVITGVALFAIGRAVVVFQRERPSLGRVLPLVLPLGVLTLFLPLFTTELWTIAAKTSWLGALAVTLVAIVPLLVLLAREMRDTSGAVFEHVATALATAHADGERQPPNWISKLVYGVDDPAERRLDALVVEALCSDKSRHRATRLAGYTKRSFNRRILLGLLPLVLGTWIATSGFVYVLTALTFDETIVSLWLRQGVADPQPIGHETAYLLGEIPTGPYPYVAILLGTLTTVGLLTSWITNRDQRTTLANVVMRRRIERLLLLALPYGHLAVHHDVRASPRPIGDADGRLVDNLCLAVGLDAADAGTLWYRWQAPAEGLMSFTARSRAFRPAVEIFREDADDDGRPRPAADATALVQVRPDESYLVSVTTRGGANESAGRFRLEWHLAKPPRNDAWARAPELEAESGGVLGDNRLATLERGEPLHVADGGRSVWYRWTPPFTGWARLEATSDDGAAIPVPYTGGALDRLEPLPDVIRGRAPIGQWIRVKVTAGKALSIAVDSPGVGGPFLLGWAPSIANDDFATAEALEGQWGSTRCSTTHATREHGEPDHAGGHGEHSVWFAWRAPESAPITFDTAGSEFDTVLAVYVGDAIDELTHVVSNDDAWTRDSSRERHPLEAVTSAVTFDAREGVTYMVAVDGRADAHGEATLSWRPAAPPDNDRFLTPQEIGGAAGEVRGDNSYAHREDDDEPHHARRRGGKSLWYAWEAPADAWVTFDTTDSSFDTLLAVYTGDELTALDEVAANDDIAPRTYTSRVVFRATRGTRYRIAVDGFLGDNGPFHLRWAPAGRRLMARTRLAELARRLRV